jgi:hypothetical protein
MSVRPLPTPQQRLDNEVIAHLERTLEEAREGKFESVMIVMLRADGEVGTRFSKGVDVLRRIGALETLKFDALSVSAERE